MMHKLVSGKQNKWFDAESIGEIDLSVEQDYNNKVQSGIIHNHFGSGVLLDSLDQKVLFDSDYPLISIFDGISIGVASANFVASTGQAPYIQQPTDNILGTQLEVSLHNSGACGNRKVKVIIIGKDFQGNVQHDSFSFRKNESKVTSKHYTYIFDILINDFKGSSTKSLNLGGRILIKEANKLSLSKDNIMVGQDLQPDLIFRDFFVNDDSLDLIRFLRQSSTALGYNYDNLNITTAAKQDRYLHKNDVVSQIGQKFIATTNNIQKITTLLSIEATSGDVNNIWTGELIFSLYALQSDVVNYSDFVPNSAIDFDPSNIPLAQQSISYASLLDKGITLDGNYQPIDFVLSNTQVGKSKGVIPGQYYCFTLRRSGTPDKYDIKIPVANDLVENAKVVLFDGDSWINIDEEDLWFNVYTDAVKISDGQMYENGYGSQIEKVIFDTTKGYNIDYTYNKLSAHPVEQQFAYLQSKSIESDLVQNQITGNQTYSRKQNVINVSLINSLKLNELKRNENPLLAGSYQDKNFKRTDKSSDSLSLDHLMIIKDTLYVDYNSMSSLGNSFTDGSLLGSKLSVGTNSYKVAKAELITLTHGDLNRDGIVDSNDQIELSKMVGFDLTQYPSTLSEYLFVTNNSIGNNSSVTCNCNSVIFTGNFADVTETGEVTLLANTNIDFSLPLNTVITVTASAYSSNIGSYTVLSATSYNPSSNRTIVLKKKLLNEINYLKVLCGNVNDTGVSKNKITDSDNTALINFNNRSVLNNYIGSTFKVLKIKCEKYIDRTDDYYNTSIPLPNRIDNIHLSQDIVADNYSLFSGISLSTPLSISFQYKFNWFEENVVIDSNIRSVTCNFIYNEKDGKILNPRELPTIESPIGVLSDPGKNDEFIPSNLILGGNILNSKGEYHKLDIEVGNIVLEIPTSNFSDDKVINLFEKFVCSDGASLEPGYTSAKFPAMKFADGSYVLSDALDKNQVRFSVSLQSFYPSIDGSTAVPPVSGIIIDEKIGVYMDYVTGHLYLNFSNLTQDTIHQTLNTKIQVTVLLKKSGFNNTNSIISLDQVSNMLQNSIAGYSTPTSYIYYASADKIFYDDQLHTPHINKNNVQDALDYLKANIGATPAELLAIQNEFDTVNGNITTLSTTVSHIIPNASNISPDTLIACKRFVIPVISGMQISETDGVYISIGAAYFNVDEYFPLLTTAKTKKVKFTVCLETAASTTGYAKLYDLNLGTDILLSELSTTSESSTILQSPALSLTGQQFLEVQLKISGVVTPGTDRVICKLAQIEIYYE